MDIAPEWEHCRDLLLGTATGIRETGGDDTEEKKWWEVAGRKEYAIVLILKKKKSSVTKKLYIQLWALQSSPQMTVPSTTIYCFTERPITGFNH